MIFLLLTISSALVCVNQKQYKQVVTQNLIPIRLQVIVLGKRMNHPDKSGPCSHFN